MSTKHPDPSEPNRAPFERAPRRTRVALKWGIAVVVLVGLTLGVIEGMKRAREAAARAE